MIEIIKGAFFGLAVGDALGVPVEFSSREQLKKSPITDMTGGGVWNQPIGTWSDDSSLAFCLADALMYGYNLDAIAAYFIDWRMSGFWGAHHKVFDVGNATDAAIRRLIKGTSPELAGGMMESDNGNGSLMRILPLLFFVKDLPIDERLKIIREVSSITHAHFRSVFACFIYIETAIQILQGLKAKDAYSKMRRTILEFSDNKGFNRYELAFFDRILYSEIDVLDEQKINSDGYVLHTLEAGLWCLLNSTSYSEAVLKAVNLGGDTDTTACITGGLAGILYGFDKIPSDWKTQIARKDDIEDLCRRFGQSISK